MQLIDANNNRVECGVILPPVSIEKFSQDAPLAKGRCGLEQRGMAAFNCPTKLRGQEL
jgi:hypothetical protein